jgi:predicted TIM-barrel fold metal-dependent hydrolase
MNISDVWAIDVHGHYGPYRQNITQLACDCMSGDAETVVSRARAARTERTIVSPLTGLLPRGGPSGFDGNEEAFAVVARTEGLLQYVILNPLDRRTLDQARRMLGQGKCVGIKVHPEEHCYPIAEHGRELFAFAAEQRAVMLVHSGEQRSLPDDYVRFANDFPEVRLILAHIGCGWDGDPGYQVRAIQKSRHGNVFADTSSARSIMPRLIEWAVHEIGADRVLFGTDTPLYFAAMQRARIDHAEIADQDKRKILRENALALFGAERLRIARAGTCR